MKRSILVIGLLALLICIMLPTVPAAGQGRPNIFMPPATATGPLVQVVNAVVTAFNNRDSAYFQKAIAPDTTWFDEDGHHLNANVWINRMLSANPPRKLSISNLRVADWGTAGWAGFNYVIEGTNQVKGTNTLMFKKNGNDWQIVLIHGAIDTPAGAH
jgi:hypothetical protein